MPETKHWHCPRTARHCLRGGKTLALPAAGKLAARENSGPTPAARPPRRHQNKTLTPPRGGKTRGGKTLAPLQCPERAAFVAHITVGWDL